MSNFNNKSITNKGLELLSAAMAGGKLEFTRIVMGSGTYSGDIGMIESLVSQKQSLDIKSLTKKGSQVILSTTLLQSSITEDFYWKEIGVYAKGNDGVEVLYMYGSATDTSFISKDMLNEKMINVGVLVSNAQNVSATIDGSLVYLSRADLEEHNTSDSAHNDIRELIKHLQGEIENIDVSWEGITGKPPTFPPSEHGHMASQITGLPTSLPANGGNADTVDGVHFHPGNASPVVSNNSPYVYAFNGGDDCNCYVKNTADLTVGNANKVGGVGLDSIARYHRYHKDVNINDTNLKQFYGTCVTGNASAPNTDWWHIINVPHQDDNGYGAQMALGYHGQARLQVRSASGTSWGGWYDVIGNIESLKSTVVSGKQSVANAINGKLGTSLSSQTSFADMAYYINRLSSLNVTIEGLLKYIFNCDYQLVKEKYRRVYDGTLKLEDVLSYDTSCGPLNPSSVSVTTNTITFPAGTKGAVILRGAEWKNSDSISAKLTNCTTFKLFTYDYEGNRTSPNGTFQALRWVIPIDSTKPFSVFQSFHGGAVGSNTLTVLRGYGFNETYISKLMGRQQYRDW